MATGDLITVDYQLETGGLLMGPLTNLGVESLSGFEDLPVIRGGNYPFARDHGSLAGLRLAGDRQILAKLYIEDGLAPLSSAAFRTLINQLKMATVPAGAEQVLAVQLPGWGKVQCSVQCVARTLPITQEYLHGQPGIDIEWIASDPVMYSQTLTSTVVPPYVGPGGLSYPVTYPKSYGGTGGGGATFVPNAGTWVTWPRFTITGPSSGTVTPTSIQNATTGDVINFSGLVIPAGSTLVIDTHPARRTVIFTDGSSRWNTVIGTTWWGIAPGGANLVFQATGTTTGVTFTAQTRDAYL